MNDHKIENRDQNELTGGHNIWNINWREDGVRNKLMSHSIESAGQAVGVRSDKRCRPITFGIDTAACRTVVLARHPATRGYRCHWDVEPGVEYSTAAKSVVWDGGRRLLVSKDTDDRILTSRGKKASDGCQTHDTTRTMGLFRA